MSAPGAQQARLILEPETHTYTIDGRACPGVTEVLACAGLVDLRWFTEYHRWRGSAVHQAAYFLDEDDLDWEDWDRQFPELTGYLRAYQQFKTDSGFQPELIESLMYEPTHGYAGTVDRIGPLNGVRALIDLKNISILPAYAIQTAAYASAAAANGYPVAKRFCLHLHADGTYKLKQHKSPNDWDIFLAALRLTEWKMENLKWKRE